MSRSKEQLDFPFPREGSAPRSDGRLERARRLRVALETRLGEPVHLTVTNNRRSVIAVRVRADGGHALRVHQGFLDAEPAVVRALARYVARRDPTASRELSRFVAENKALFESDEKPARLPRTRGRHHDLQSIFDEVNATYFDGEARARITWGTARARAGRSQRTIKLGSYALDERLVRIHPALDADFVPRFFVAWVVYHELLHHALGAALGGPRYHGVEFRERERAFADYERAMAWERAHIERLLHR